MTEGDEDEGKSEIQKFDYLENEKNFLDEVESNFHNYLSAIIYWMNKIEDTSLELSKN